ncbi:MAG: MFS transporter [Chlamydiales bacterium]|nr:MFS transporter [Chlamydiales bacterium]
MNTKNIRLELGLFRQQVLNNYSWIPLLAILVDGLHKIYFLTQLKYAQTDVEVISAVWVALQVVFSTFFGLLSDRFCRKKILLLGLGLSMLTLPLLKMGFFWYAILLSGVFGNLAPVARAAYCDVQVHHNMEPNIINTFLILPLPYIMLSFDYNLFIRSSFVSIYSIGIVTFFLCLIFFKDKRDRESRKVALQSFPKLKEKFINGPSIRLIVSFFIINSGWWILTYFAEGHLALEKLLQYFFLIIGLSFLAGAIMCRAYLFKPEKAIPPLFLGIVLLFIFDFLFYVILGKQINSTTFMHMTIIGGIALPLIYAYYGNQAAVHEQGTVYGVLESVRSLTELSGPLFLSLVAITNTSTILIPLSIIAFLLVITLNKPSFSPRSHHDQTT